MRNQLKEKKGGAPITAKAKAFVAAIAAMKT